MAYQLIEDYTLSFTGGSMDPKGFAIHWWGDPIQKPTFDGILKVLIQAAEVERASVNFMAEAGKVACLVDPFTIAWGQGDGATGWGNNNLVSIECNPRCTAADRETVAELIADQHIRNGIPIVLYPHNKFTATQCPGVWEQYLPWLTTRAKQIVAEKTKTTTGGTTVASAWDTKIQEYQTDGKTKKIGKPWKTAAFIIGNIDQYVTRILKGQDEIKKTLAEIKANQCTCKDHVE